MSSTRNIDIARAAWGTDLPDWVQTLAEACDRTSQVAAGKLTGLQGPVINSVLHRKYGVIDNEGIKRHGNLAAVEAAVRGALMAATVQCPALLKQLPMQDCIANQKLPFAAVNHARVKLYRACRACPNSLIPGAAAAAGGKP